MKRIIIAIIFDFLAILSIGCQKRIPDTVDSQLQGITDSLVHYYVYDLEFAEQLRVTILDSIGDTVVTSCKYVDYAVAKFPERHNIGALIYPILAIVDIDALEDRYPIGSIRLGGLTIHDKYCIRDSVGEPVDSLRLTDALVYSSPVAFACFSNSKRKGVMETISSFFPDMELSADLKHTDDSVFFRIALGEFLVSPQQILDIYKILSNSCFLEESLRQVAASFGIGNVACMWYGYEQKNRSVNLLAGYHLDSRCVFLVEAVGCQTHPMFVAELINNLFSSSN